MFVRKILVGLLVGAFALWLPLALVDVAGQRALFSGSSQDWLSDYWMPRLTCETGYSSVPSEALRHQAPAEGGWRDADWLVARHDRCYPPAGTLFLRIFPLSCGGAWAWTILGGLVYLAAACFAARSFAPLFLAASAPFLFNLALGNTVWLSAAAVALFLSGYRSERRDVRLLSALALGVAAAMKVSPAVLGLLYLPDVVREARRREFTTLKLVLVAAFAAAALFVLPFAAMPDGFGGLPAMMENAAANADYYCTRAAFGLGALWRTVQIALGHGWDAQDGGLVLLQRCGQLLGLGFFVRGVLRRDLLLVVGGYLLLTPNTMFYGLLYLLPVAFLERLSRWELLCLLAMTCPLQLALPIGGTWLSANGAVANVALLAGGVMRSAKREASTACVPGCRQARYLV